MSDATTAPPAAVARDAHWAEKMRRIKARKPIERSLVFWLDETAQRELAVARQGEISAQADVQSVTTDEERALAAAAVTSARRRLVEAETAAAEASVDVTLRGLPALEYEALMAQHPPSDEQKTEGFDYDPDSFAPALISTCSIDGMSVEDATWLMENLNQSEAGQLFTTAIAVCVTSRVDAGKGSGPTRS